MARQCSGEVGHLMVTLGHLRVTLGYFRVTIRVFRVTSGHLKDGDGEGYSRLTIGH